LTKTIRKDKYLYEQVKGREYLHKSWKDKKKDKFDHRRKGFKPPFNRNNPNKISKINTLIINPRDNTPREMGEYHQSNVGDAKNITCTRIYLTKNTMKTMHNIQEATIVEDMNKHIPRIYAALEDRQTKNQSHMIEVEGKIINPPVVILIDLG
jgi:hypothetical protein